MALAALKGGLEEWRTQLRVERSTDIENYKRLYTDAKSQLDEVKLKLALYEKEYGPIRIASGG